MVTNDEVRKRSGMGKLEEILRKKRLRWLGHLHRMSDDTKTGDEMERRRKVKKRKTTKELEDDNN